MGAPLKPITQQPFDEARFGQLLAPLTCRVDKFKGSNRTPIKIPESDEGHAGGTDLTHDDVRKIEEWLLTGAPGGGGGLYEISVADASTPAQSMRWRPFWDARTYPELGPDGLPTSQPPGPGQVIPFSPIAQPTPSQGRQFMPPVWPNGLPGPQYQAQAPYPYAPQPMYYPQMGAPPQVGSPQWSMYQAEDSKRRMEDENRILREKQADAERAALQAQHRAELRSAEQATEARFARQESQMGELRTLLAQLTQTIQNGATQQAKNPELEALKEQHRQTEIKYENERREREAERRDQLLREQIKAIQDSTARQLEAMQRQSETTIAAASANKHDPMVAFMQEQTRQHNEALKEMARSNSTALEKMQMLMMTPRDMFAMAKESTAAADVASDRVAQQFSRVIEMQQKVTENALQMAPQGNGALDLVRDGVNGFKDIAERYMGTRATEKRLEADANRMTHDAQLKLAQTQIFAQAQAAAQAAQPVQPPPIQVPAHLAGLGSTPVPPPPAAKKRKKVAKEQVQEALAEEPKRLGKTDEEWFGALMPEVEILREQVDVFLESIQIGRADPKTGAPQGASPEQAAMGVIQAVAMVTQKRYPIPVMIELFFQQRYADFVDVLIPDAPQLYRDDLVVAIIAQVKHHQDLAGEDTSNTRDHSQGKTNGAANENDGDADDDDDDEADPDENATH